MIAIRLTTESTLEEALQLIICNGLVEYTEHEDTFLVPMQTLALLDQHEISYEMIPHHRERDDYQPSEMMR